MQHINRPDINVNDVLRDSNANIDVDLAQRFRDEITFYRRVERAYVRRGEKGEWGQFTRSLRRPVRVTGDDLEALYDQRMVRESSGGREHYVMLRDSGKRKLCSYCFARNAEELDHYLPKKKWPQLCFLPVNLVPSCGKCNKRKSEHFHADRTRQPIHPYFEDLDSLGWLKAVIEEGNPIPFFQFERHETAPVLSDRVEWQAKRMRLSQLYHERAGTLYQEMELRLFDEFGAAAAGQAVSYDPLRVSAFLNDEASRSFRLLTRNHWKVQCLKSWRDDDWFLSEGCQPSEARASELANRARAVVSDSF